MGRNFATIKSGRSGEPPREPGTPVVLPAIVAGDIAGYKPPDAN